MLSFGLTLKLVIIIFKFSSNPMIKLKSARLAKYRYPPPKTLFKITASGVIKIDKIKLKPKKLWPILLILLAEIICCIFHFLTFAKLNNQSAVFSANNGYIIHANNRQWFIGLVTNINIVIG